LALKTIFQQFSLLISDISFAVIQKSLSEIQIKSAFQFSLGTQMNRIGLKIERLLNPLWHGLAFERKKNAHLYRDKKQLL
jgi:hypothetical protein